MSCEEYRVFLEEFHTDEEILIIKVGPYRLLESEILGEVINWTLQYLSENKCPTKLSAPITRNVVETIQNQCRKDPHLCGFDEKEKTFEPSKLKNLVILALKTFCQRLLDNVELNKILPDLSVENYTPICITGAVRNKRRAMEDRHICIDDFNETYNIQNASKASFYAVFDGHDGYNAAYYTAAQLPYLLATSPLYLLNPAEAMRQSFRGTDHAFIQKAYQQSIRGGTTAVCALYLPNQSRLYVGWVGDSKALLVKQGKIMQIVKPHKPEDPKEKKRIIAAGGSIINWGGMWRVDGLLNLSRAIGDSKCKPYVTSDPDIVGLELDKNEDFLVIACDGLWDFVAEDKVAEIIYEQLKEDTENLNKIPQKLIEKSKQEGSTDNITIIIVFLKDPYQIVKNTCTIEIMEPAFDNCNIGEFDSEKQVLNTNNANTTEIDFNADQTKMFFDDHQQQHQHLNSNQLIQQFNDGLNNFLHDPKNVCTNMVTNINNHQFELKNNFEQIDDIEDKDNFLDDLNKKRIDDINEQLIDDMTKAETPTDFEHEACIDVTDDIAMVTTENSENSTISHSKDTLPLSDHLNSFDNKLSLENQSEYNPDNIDFLQGNELNDDDGNSTPMLSPDSEEIMNQGSDDIISPEYEQPVAEELASGIEFMKQPDNCESDILHQHQENFESDFIQTNGHISPGKEMAYDDREQCTPEINSNILKDIEHEQNDEEKNENAFNVKILDEKYENEIFGLNSIKENHFESNYVDDDDISNFDLNNQQNVMVDEEKVNDNSSEINMLSNNNCDEMIEEKLSENEIHSNAMVMHDVEELLRPDDEQNIEVEQLLRPDDEQNIEVEQPLRPDDDQNIEVEQLLRPDEEQNIEVEQLLRPDDEQKIEVNEPPCMKVVLEEHICIPKSEMDSQLLQAEAEYPSNDIIEQNNEIDEKAPNLFEIEENYLLPTEEHIENLIEQKMETYEKHLEQELEIANQQQHFNDDGFAEHEFAEHDTLFEEQNCDQPAIQQNSSIELEVGNNPFSQEQNKIVLDEDESDKIVHLTSDDSIIDATISSKIEKIDNSEEIVDLVNKTDQQLPNKISLEEQRDLLTQSEEILLSSPRPIDNSLNNTSIATDLDDDMNYQLNPEAKEFIPLSPPVTTNVFLKGDNNGILLNGDGILKITQQHLGGDDVVAQSPRKCTAVNMDEIYVPDQKDFDTEIRHRPHEIIESAEKDENSIVASPLNKINNDILKQDLFQNLDLNDEIKNSNKDEDIMTLKDVDCDESEIINPIYNPVAEFENIDMKDSIYIEKSSSNQPQENYEFNTNEDILNRVQLLPESFDSNKNSSNDFILKEDIVSNENEKDIASPTNEIITIANNSITVNGLSSHENNDENIDNVNDLNNLKLSSDGTSITGLSNDAVEIDTNITGAAAVAIAATSIVAAGVTAAAIPSVTDIKKPKTKVAEKKIINKINTTKSPKVPEKKLSAATTAITKTTTLTSAQPKKPTPTSSKTSVTSNKPKTLTVASAPAPKTITFSRPRTAPAAPSTIKNVTNSAATTTTTKSRIDASRPATLTVKKTTAKTTTTIETKTNPIKPNVSKIGITARSSATSRISATNTMSKPRPASATTSTVNSGNATATAKTNQLRPAAGKTTVKLPLSPRGTYTSTLRKTEAIKSPTKTTTTITTTNTKSAPKSTVTVRKTTTTTTSTNHTLASGKPSTTTTTVQKKPSPIKRPVLDNNKKDTEKLSTTKTDNLNGHDSSATDELKLNGVAPVTVDLPTV